MDEEEMERRRHAVDTAMGVASRYGVLSDRPEVIKDSNNTIVHLAPTPVVAKVATTTLPGRENALDREMAVLRYLASTVAPVVRPSRLLDPGPHEAGGYRLIFLEHLGDHSRPLDARVGAGALAALHGAVRGYTRPLPEFTEAMDQARGLLANESATAALPADERSFLLRAVDALRDPLPGDRSRWQALHGDPWEGGNLLSTPGGPVLVDFEAACVGPIEWDYSSLGDNTVAAAQVPLDRELLDVLRAWRSLTVSVWCWSQPGRAPEVDEAARWHLHQLHQRLDR